MATINWILADNGQWSVPNNWDLNRIPETGDDIVIAVDNALPTVTLDTAIYSPDLIIGSLLVEDVFQYTLGNINTDTSSVLTFDGDINGDGVDLVDFSGNLVPDGFVDDISVLGPPQSSTFTNNGIINVINGGYLVLGRLNGGSIVNASTINVGNATTPGRLVFNLNWTNAPGTVNLNGNGSELILGGEFSLNNLGTINRTGNNTVAIVGTLDLTGNVLPLNATTGDFELRGGEITSLTDTTIQQNGAQLTFTSFDDQLGQSQTFDPNVITNLVSVTGTSLDLSPDGSSVILVDVLDPNFLESGDLNLGNDAQLVFENTNGGTFVDEIINLNGSNSSLRISARSFGNDTSALLLEATAQVNLIGNNSTLGSDIELDGTERNQGVGIIINLSSITASGSGLRFINPDQFINEGTVTAEDTLELRIGDVVRQNGTGSPLKIVENIGTIAIDDSAIVTLIGDFTNTGQINISDSGTLQLQGPFNPSDIGTINRTGGNTTVAITGQLEDDGGGNLVIGSNTGDIFVDGGQIIDVGVDQTNGNRLLFTDNPNNILTGPQTIVNGDVNLTETNSIAIFRDEAIFTGSANLTGDSAALILDTSGQNSPPIEFNGSQVFNLDAPNAVFGLQATDTLILGDNVVVNLSGTDTALTSDLGTLITQDIGTGRIVNRGTINSNSTGSINPDIFKNEGVLTANPGATLTVGGRTFSFDDSGDETVVENYDESTQTLSEGTWQAIDGTLNVINIENNAPTTTPIANNDATILLSGSNAQFPSLTSLTNNLNSLTIENGSQLTVDTSALTNTGSLKIGNSSGLTVNGDFNQDAGDLSGEGSITANLVTINGGDVNPGDNNPGGGSLSVVGDYTQATGATVTIELASPSDFDNINISGTAAFGNNALVDIDLVNNFVPQQGDTFTIFNYASQTNATSIDFIDLPDLGPGLQFRPVINSDNITLQIVEAGANTPPVAVDDNYATTQNQTLTIPAIGVLENDLDDDGDPLTANLVGSVSNGTLIFNSDGSFEYTPATDFSGTDTFTYVASDGTDNSNVATVTIQIAEQNTPPIARNDAYVTNENETLTIPAIGVLENDTDPDGNSLTANLVGDVSNGTLTLQSDGSFEYIPDADFNGIDTFTYLANDGLADSNVATVTIFVADNNTPPIARNDSYVTNENQTLTIPAIGVLENDIDIDGDPLTANLVGDVSNGDLNLLSDGSFEYIPDAGFTGTDTFTYRANDGTADSNLATVSIVVVDQNTPPVARNDSYITNENQTLTIAAIGVLENDIDVDGDPLTANLVGDVSNGDLSLFSDGSFEYIPDAGFTGTDTFTYRANDGTADSNLATVSIVVAGQNTPPLARNDNYTTTQNQTLTILPIGVLENDIDVDGDPLTANLVGDVSNGDLSLQSDGSFIYTPDAGFTGTDTFTYRANDGTADSNLATVSIEVNTPGAGEIVSGSAGFDSLVGGDGDDTLTGFQRRDTLTGGPGADEFVYVSTTDVRDTITDFTPSEGDLINFAELLDNIGYTGSDPIGEGIVTFTDLPTQGGSAVNIDPDGFAGPAGVVFFIFTENINAADVSQPSNFIFS